MHLFFFQLLLYFLPNTQCHIRGVQTEKNTTNQNLSLVFALEHYRHGIRSPCNGLDNDYLDIFNEKWEGIGELTHLGMLQFFNIGLQNRKKYSSLFNNNYGNISFDQILFYSTNVNRTIMSAQALIQGMFYNENNYTINKTIISNFNMNHIILPFIPVPIHLLENDDDKHGMFNYQLIKYCPRLKKYRKENKKSLKIQKFISDFQQKYGEVFILEVLKRRNIHQIQLDSIKLICSAYISDFLDNREISILNDYSINKEELFNDCLELSYLSHFEIDQGNRARIGGVLTMGPHANNIIEYMDNHIYKRNYKPKYVMYSGHDTTVTALQVFLEKAFDIEVRKIPFASCMMFHLLKDDKENYYVKYFFNDELMLNITFNEFKSQIKKIAWKDYQIEDFCHVFTNKEKLMIIMIEALFALLIFNIILVSYFCRGKRRNYVKFSNMPKSGNTSMKKEEQATKKNEDSSENCKSDNIGK